MLYTYFLTYIGVDQHLLHHRSILNRHQLFKKKGVCQQDVCFLSYKEGTSNLPKVAVWYFLEVGVILKVAPEAMMVPH